MDFLTGTILSGIAYDIFKRGVILSAENLRKRLRQWIISDAELSAISNELNKLKLTEEMSELAIEGRINSSPELKLFLENIKPVSSEANTIVQQHTGSGDNVGRDKIINNHPQETLFVKSKNGTRTVTKIDPDGTAIDLSASLDCD